MGDPARQALAGRHAVRLQSERFGTHAVPRDHVLLFPDGLIGFPDARRFALLEPGPPGAVFRQLVCVDQPELGFVVCDPAVVRPDYAADLPLADDSEREALTVLVIVTIRSDPRATTADLHAPLVVDRRTRKGRQLMLDADRYSARQRLIES